MVSVFMLWVCCNLLSLQPSGLRMYYAEGCFSMLGNICHARSVSLCSQGCMLVGCMPWFLFLCCGCVVILCASVLESSLPCFFHAEGVFIYPRKDFLNT